MRQPQALSLESLVKDLGNPGIPWSRIFARVLGFLGIDDVQTVRAERMLAIYAGTQW